MTKDETIITVRVTKCFDGKGKVCAYNVNVDGRVYREVSKSQGLLLCQEAFEVSKDHDWGYNLIGHGYFFQ